MIIIFIILFVFISIMYYKIIKDINEENCNINDDIDDNINKNIQKNDVISIKNIEIDKNINILLQQISFITSVYTNNIKLNEYVINNYNENEKSIANINNT